VNVYNLVVSDEEMENARLKGKCICCVDYADTPGYLAVLIGYVYNDEIYIDRMEKVNETS
jgi:hypothetical protein